MTSLKNAMEMERQRLREKMSKVSSPIPGKCRGCGYLKCVCKCPGCEICGGSGFVLRAEDLPVTNPDFGKTDLCPNFTRKYLRDQMDSGNEIGGLAPDEIETLNWSMVKNGFSDGPKARDAVRGAYERGSGLVLLFGGFGQAKTLTMKIAVAQALRDGKKARYAKLTRVLDDIRLAYDMDERKMSALLDKIKQWRDLDVLALDEMDKAAKDSPWAQDRVFNLIDDRYELAMREQALTITAGNWQNLDDLNGPLGYFRSRIEDNRFATFGLIVYLNGKDGRKFMPPGHHF